MTDIVEAELPHLAAWLCGAPKPGQADEAADTTAALRVEVEALREALQNLSDSADEINGEQDAQLYNERGRNGWDWGDDYKTEVTICEGQWRKLNVDLCAAQGLLNTKHAVPGGDQ